MFRVVLSLKVIVMVSPSVYNALLVFGVHVVSWHIFAAFFAWLDHTGPLGQWPGRLVWHKYKMVKKDNVTYWGMMPVVLFNQFFIMMPSMTLVAYFELGFIGHVVPYYMFPVHAYLLGVIHDVVFYVGHKLLHTNFLYKHVHYLHHRSLGGSAASSMYMTPIDFFVEIILPYSVFLALVGTDTRFDVALASIGSLFAMYEHSGYCFTKMHAFDSRMHMSHHSGRLNGSFAEGVGSPGYCDMLFGTQLKPDSAIMLQPVGDEVGEEEKKSK